MVFRWAELTAGIFLHSGYKVKLYSQVTPTPFVPFAVAKYKNAIGVMVTASHNPKEDNGYKVSEDLAKTVVQPFKRLEELNSLKTSLLGAKIVNVLSYPWSKMKWAKQIFYIV